MSSDNMRHFIFEKYIESDGNSFAKKVCMRVAETADSKYSPLLIIGESGAGKTHLAKAIEISINDNHQDKNVIYVDADSYTNDVIESIRGSFPEAKSFRAKYKDADVFIFDGLEKINKRDASKEELFGIIDNLQKCNKTIVLTSTLGVEKMFNDHCRLKRIIEASFCVRIEKQDSILIDYMVHQELLKDLSLSENVVWFIKRNCEEKASKAKGIINTIKMWIDIYGQEPSEKELREIYNTTEDYGLFMRRDSQSDLFRNKCEI